MKKNASANKSYFVGLVFVLGILGACTKDKDPVVGATNKVTITTIAITSITSDSAVSGGNITSDGGDPITERGVCWAITEKPTVTNDKSISGAGIGTYTSKLINLNPNTTYYVRAYGKNTQGEIYGEQLSFKTSTRKPTLSTDVISSITHISATAGGNILSDGGAPITSKGICWSTTNALPTTSDNALVATGTSNTFTASITGLLGNTIYYLRAYAINSVGIGYGAMVQFKTDPAKVPSLSAVATSSLTRNSFVADASLVSNEGASILQYGFCWGLSNNPTIANSATTTAGPIAGPYSRTIANLSPNTAYYVRAFATNSVGTGYSAASTLVTTDRLLAPQVLTTSVGNIGLTNAVLSGNVSDDGGASVTDRGFYYGTTNPPATGNLNKIASGSGTGSYSVSLNGLQSNTDYYFRAYATNSQGTTMANAVLNFRTLIAQKPTLSTVTPSTITSTSFSSGGTILSDGGANIIDRGICWSTSSAPTTSNNKISGASGSNFSALVTGLNPNTFYSIRAYATNSSGDGYGDEYRILTLLREPVLGAPLNGSNVSCCTANFSWSSVSGATSYELQISRNSSFTGTLFALGVCGGGTSLRIGNLNTYTTSTTSVCVTPGTAGNIGSWYWRVRASSASNNGDWSSVRTFNYQN